MLILIVERASSTSYSSRIKVLPIVFMQRYQVFFSTDIFNTKHLQRRISFLIQENAALSRKTLRWLIEERVTSVAQAADGDEAMIYIWDNSEVLPDVIFMYYVMPTMDGPTATRETKEQGYRGLIIGVTGKAL